MLSVEIAADWWKWGIPNKRKSLTDYPKFKNHIEQLWNKNLNGKAVARKKFNVITNEERSSSTVRIYTEEFPALKISGDPELRLKKSLGKSYSDLLAAATGTAIEIPDAVLFPQSHDDVLKILRIASEKKIMIIAFGGGTNVVGSMKIPGRSQQPRIVIDLSEMNRLVDLDTVNHTAIFQCGTFGPALENILNEKGFTLGHFPQSFEFSTLGGWIATRSAGQESSSYGRIEDMTISLKVATPVGTISTSNYEGDAEGINIKHLYFGSEGMFGVVTEAKVRIHRLPKIKKWLIVLFPEFQNGLTGLKELVQSGIFPSVIRYSDENETFFLSLLSHEKPSFFSKIKTSFKKTVLKWKSLSQPHLMMIRMDGTEKESELKRSVAADILKKYGGFTVGESLGKKWESSRFGLPYLQDDLIERGIFVDTMETVLPWNQINAVREKLYRTLRSCDEFKREKGILLSHISHVYDSCASIYFTVITDQDKSHAYEQWKKIKTLALDTIVDNGGAVSHHHSIGTDLKKWYLQKTDLPTKEILKSVKNTLDPNHILNPGKLFDE